MRLTKFDSILSTHGTPEEYDSEACYVVFGHHLRVPEKDRAPLWAPVTFTDNRRLDENVESVHALVFDYDQTGDRPTDPYAIRERMDEHGIEAYVYSTFSATKEKPKFRLVVPLAYPVDVSLHRSMMEAFYEDLLGSDPNIDVSCFNPGRIYYMPSCHYSDYPDSITYAVDADPIDASMLDLSKARTSATSTEPAGRNDKLKQIAYAALSRDPQPPITDIVGDLVLYDFGRHDPPLFDDPSEPLYKKGATPHDRALRFLNNVARTWQRRDERGMVDKRPAEVAPDIVAQIPTEEVSTFLDNLKPPTYVVDGMFAKGYVYAVTGHPGSGKTVMAVELALQVAMGDMFLGRMTMPGRVLYLAGENPDDLRKRLKAAMDQHQLQPENLTNLTFVPKAFPLGPNLPVIRSQFADRVWDLVIVDTDVAYYGGQDENDNVQRREHAAYLRSLTELEGSPAVVVLSHPNKGARGDVIVPRGGGSFLGEIDCAIILDGDENASQMRPHPSKYRGLPFTPRFFKSEVATLEGMVNNITGEGMTTVVCVELGETEMETQESVQREREQFVLWEYHENKSISQRELSRRAKARWGEDAKCTSLAGIQRVIAKLEAKGHLTEGTGKDRLLSPAGRKAAGIKQEKGHE